MINSMMSQDEIIKQIKLHKETIAAVENLEKHSPITDPMFMDIVKLRSKMKNEAHARIGKLQRLLEAMHEKPVDLVDIAKSILGVK